MRLSICMSSTGLTSRASAVDEVVLRRTSGSGTFLSSLCGRAFSLADNVLCRAAEDFFSSFLWFSSCVSSCMGSGPGEGGRPKARLFLLDEQGEQYGRAETEEPLVTSAAGVGLGAFWLLGALDYRSAVLLTWDLFSYDLLSGVAADSIILASVIPKVIRSIYWLSAPPLVVRAGCGSAENEPS